MTEERLLVTLCTYNERGNLEAMIAEIHAVAGHADILVIDDGSPDGTGTLADELAQRDSRVRVLHRPGKLGLGSAILTGFRYGVEHDYTFLINLDADFSHPPRYIPAMLDCMNRVDVAVASRYIAGGGVVGWGLRRHFMSRSVNWYARTLLRLKTADNSGSYRCFRVAKLRELDLDRFRAKGYAFQIEVLFRCRKVGCRFEEVPIVFEERRYGKSKISWNEGFLALWVIFLLAIDDLRGVSVSRMPA